MTNQGHKRRACEKEEQVDLVKCYRGIEDQLTEMNGTQKTHSKWFREIVKRVKKIEDDDIFGEGVREGKKGMKTSTRNMILTALLATGLFIAGVREIRSQKQQAVEAMTVQVAHDKTSDRDYIKKRFQGIEDNLLTILKRSMKGGRE